MNPYDFRTGEEKVIDLKWEDRLNGDCDPEDCEFCEQDLLAQIKED